MPRNGSGTMTVPNSFTPGSTISSTSVNANYSDIATELTNSLPRDGQAGMSGAMKAANGSVSAPSITFGSDPNTGLYSKSADVVGVVAGGTEVATISASGITDSNSLVLVGIPTGALIAYGAKLAPTGWVRCAGGTVGSATSGGTERANADTQNLFLFLWTHFANNECAVSSGRGASGAADFLANKTITLPDYRGRGLFGLDDMGSSTGSAGRLAAVVGTSTVNGASGGAAQVGLTEANVPEHTHTTPAHTHTFSATTGTESATHTHSGTTSSDGAHTHNANTAASILTTSGATATGTGASGWGSVSPTNFATSNGAHTHTMTTGTNSGTHTHGVSGTTDSGGASTTGTGSGSGTNLAILPPFWLGTIIMKL